MYEVLPSPSVLLNTDSTNDFVPSGRRVLVMIEILIIIRQILRFSVHRHFASYLIIPLRVYERESEYYEPNFLTR